MFCLTRKLTIVLGLISFCGCGNAVPLVPAISSTALNSPQFATIQKAQTASLVGDWPGYVACFTPESGRATLRGHLIAVTSTPVTSRDWDALFARHGITQEELDALRQLPAGDAKLKAVLDTEQQITDVAAYSADFCALLPKLMPSNMVPADGHYAGVPIDLQVIDDRATITLFQNNGKKRDVQLRFTPEGWKIDLPNG